MADEAEVLETAVKVFEYTSAFQLGSFITVCGFCGLTLVLQLLHSFASKNEHRDNLMLSFLLNGGVSAAFIAYVGVIWNNGGVWVTPGAIETPLWWWATTAIAWFFWGLMHFRHVGLFEISYTGPTHPLNSKLHVIPPLALIGAGALSASAVMLMLGVFSDAPTGYALTFGLIGLFFQIVVVAVFILVWRHLGSIKSDLGTLSKTAGSGVKRGEWTRYDWKQYHLLFAGAIILSYDLAFILGPNAANVVTAASSGIYIWYLVMHLVLVLDGALNYIGFEMAISEGGTPQANFTFAAHQPYNRFSTAPSNYVPAQQYPNAPMPYPRGPVVQQQAVPYSHAALYKNHGQ